MVECVGRPEVFPEGLKYLRKAGMYLEPGNFVDCGGAMVNVHEICANNLRIIGMNNHTHTKMCIRDRSSPSRKIWQAVAMYAPPAVVGLAHTNTSL